MTDAPIAAWLTEPVVENVEPLRGYLICATPRSGSYYLCDLLRSTGVLGRPHEYFGTLAMRRLGLAGYSGDIGDQLAAARSRGCSPNGVFGAKIFPLQIAAAGPGTIMAGMGNPRLIHLERTDKLGQAISFTRAAISNAYFAGEQGTTQPRFDAPLIRDFLDLLLRWDGAWQLWFARHGIVPLRLIYEDVVADPQRSVDRVAAFLGVSDPARIDPDRLAMTVQRDAESARWHERFLAAEPGDHAFADVRSAGTVTRQRRVRRLLGMLGLSRR